eukprot:scaffold93880_cov29-Tisochrysis_lutea.AAC.1
MVPYGRPVGVSKAASSFSPKSAAASSSVREPESSYAERSPARTRIVTSNTLTSSCSAKLRWRPTHATASSNSCVRPIKKRVSRESTSVRPIPQEVFPSGTRGSSSSAPQALEV